MIRRKTPDLSEMEEVGPKGFDDFDSGVNTLDLNLEQQQRHDEEHDNQEDHPANDPSSRNRKQHESYFSVTVVRA